MLAAMLLALAGALLPGCVLTARRYLRGQRGARRMDAAWAQVLATYPRQRDAGAASPVAAGR